MTFRAHMDNENLKSLYIKKKIIKLKKKRNFKKLRHVAGPEDTLLSLAQI